MQFAFFTHVPWPEGTDPQQIIAQTTEQVQYAEELGFCSAWLAEHHFTRYSMVCSSLILATHLAAHTRTIRIGTAVLVSPLHNPLRLAEDTAMVDLVSGGRLDVGFGRGTSGYEYAGYNVDPQESQERFQDSIKIVEGLWTTPEFTYESKFNRLEKINLVPVPVQKPHPPIYIAATRTLTTLEFLVSTGHNLCIAVVQDTADALDLCQRFVTMSQAAGHHRPMADIPFFRYFYVAETEEQVRQDTETRLNWVADIMQWRRFIDKGSEVYQRMDDWRRTRTQLPASYDYLAHKRAIVGTPDQCVAKIQELQQYGIAYFGCNFDFGGMEHQKVLRSMELFAREVMPRLRDTGDNSISDNQQR
jgi:alkanesulfonate monooxygenase SsuD/methylene tetrahydromethanopterin reductase-like flavin-dependent oxidoreductase (luciferase family)